MFHELEDKYVYLFGPMRGIPHFNYPAFMHASEVLANRDIAHFNPVDSLNPVGSSVRVFLSEDMNFITNSATALVGLPAWQYSKGACAEAATAMAIGIPIYELTKQGLTDNYQLFRVSYEAAELYGHITNKFRETAVPLKIAISGKMKSGKDTLGKLLTYYTRVPTASFAEPLKFGVGILYGEMVNERNKDELREPLQDVGEYFTSRNPYHFANLLFKRHPDIDKTGVVITDLRNPGELELCKKHGLVTVYLQVTEEQQIARGGNPDRFNHPTETRMLEYLEDFDVVLPSDITPEKSLATILELTGSESRLETLKKGLATYAS